MYRNRKLSLILAILMLVQLGLPNWFFPQSVTAAPGGPIATGFYPADDMANVPLGANLRIAFDENIKLGSSTANVSIYRSSNNQLVESISVTSGRVTILNQREATIDPLLELTANKFSLDTEYYVRIDAGAFLNVSNDAPYTGIQSATHWNFRTTASMEDSVKPNYTARAPENGTHPITSQISITFDEPVYASAGFISLESTDDTRSIPVTSSSVTGSGSRTITIVPTGALLPTTTYTVRIGNDNFKDASGNAFDSIFWSFKTSSAPVNLAKIDPLTPADDAALVNVASDLVLRFDQHVQANEGKTVEIRRVSDNVAVETYDAKSTFITINDNMVTINPSKDLIANTAYYVMVQPGAFSRKGNAGEWFYGITAATIWNFTTGYGDDQSAPAATGLSPANNGTTASTNTNLVITFNEEVYPNTGNIEIRQSVGGTLFRSIPITSSRVKGGGTKQLTIDATNYISPTDPAKPFLNNTKYYVTIGNRAIRDGAGNFFTSITESYQWQFTITADSARPTLTGLNPANGSTAVDLATYFIATFNKPIAKGTDPTKGISFVTLKSGTPASLPAAYYVDPDNNNRMVIVPTKDAPLVGNTNYYINIDEGAITDMVGNPFIGILNQNQWTFLTKGGDTTAPTLTKSEVSGSSIRLIYNEPLNATLKPSPASYYVTVAGVPLNVNDVRVEGNMVLLTLVSQVGYNQKVELSYTKPTLGLVQDLTGNQAASLSKTDISNGFTSTTPVVSNGSVSGNTVVLNFSEALMTPSAYAYTQFSVNVGGTNYSTTAIWQSGNVIQLTLDRTIPGGQYVRVSYTSGSYPIYGSSGNTVSSFSNYDVIGGNNGSGAGVAGIPYVQYITASGTLVTIKYSETLNNSSVPGLYQYSVLVDGQARMVSNVVIANDTVYLTIGASLSAGQTIVVSYVGNGTSLKDLSGIAAPSFSGVIANSGIGTGGIGGMATMQSATLKGSKLTLNFNTVLDASSMPSANLFLVRIGETVRVVSHAQVIGTTVILTLATPANVGEKAEVSYYANANTNSLKALGGHAVSSFTNVAVINETTLLDALSGDYEAADGGDGVAIKSTGAMVSSDISPAGVSANRYTVMSDKFLTAVKTARSSGLNSTRIVFKVPDQERAGIVAIQVIAFEMAAKLGGDVTFAVQHGDATFELPLSTLNLAELAKTAGGNSVTNHVLIAIDKGDPPKTSALTTALNSSKATIIAGPISYEAFIVNNSNKQELNFSGYVSRSLKTSSIVTTSQSSVVWLDSVTGALTYVPTTFKTENGVTRATFKRKGNSAYALVRNTSSFSDVDNHWAAASIEMMARKYIVEGHTVSKFEPNKSITRGEFATYIAKGLGLTGDRTAAAKFKDVNKDTVMGAYIGAAAAAGIVNGVDSSNFKPNSYITRQDMATMMMRAAKVTGLKTTLPNSANFYVEKFKDRKKISSYALTNVAEAINLGIINGKTATTLSPTTNASRAEGTVMIMRLLEKAEFLSK